MPHRGRIDVCLHLLLFLPVLPTVRCWQNVPVLQPGKRLSCDEISLRLAAMMIATPAEKTVPSGRCRSAPSRYRPSRGRPVGQAPPPGQTVTHHATALRVCRALLRKALHWQTPMLSRAAT
ncbi:hypothetical protein BGLA2_700053 [Burkholderia gladioli]|nr:hypothetical protein BGLA2_700053 [Burkholderia gladioli]